MKSDFLAQEFGGRLIVIRGIGRMFYQNGFPIPLSISVCKGKGYEVSILHVADECMKNGWDGDTAYAKISADFQDSLEKIDMKELKEFCYSTYERQRELIFNYLFNNIEESKIWLRHSLVQTST